MASADANAYVGQTESEDALLLNCPRVLLRQFQGKLSHVVHGKYQRLEELSLRKEDKVITRHIQTKIMHRMVEHNCTIYLGGVTADDCSQDMKGQTQQICKKIDDFLAQVGSSKEKLLTTMIYISDFSQKDRMNEAWFEWLPGQYLPTRATIGVADLGEDCLVEVVVSAAKS